MIQIQTQIQWQETYAACTQIGSVILMEVIEGPSFKNWRNRRAYKMWKNFTSGSVSAAKMKQIFPTILVWLDTKYLQWLHQYFTLLTAQELELYYVSLLKLLSIYASYCVDNQQICATCIVSSQFIWWKITSNINDECSLPLSHTIDESSLQLSYTGDDTHTNAESSLIISKTNYETGLQFFQPNVF